VGKRFAERRDLIEENTREHRAECCSKFVVCVDLHFDVLQNFLLQKVKLLVEGKSFGDISEIQGFHCRASSVL